MGSCNIDSVPRIQLRLDDEFVVPFNIDESFTISNKKDLLKFVFYSDTDEMFLIA